jgi:hypothetical protein
MGCNGGGGFAPSSASRPALVTTWALTALALALALALVALVALALVLVTLILVTLVALITLVALVTLVALITLITLVALFTVVTAVTIPPACIHCWSHFPPLFALVRLACTRPRALVCANLHTRCRPRFGF